MTKRIAGRRWQRIIAYGSQRNAAVPIGASGLAELAFPSSRLHLDADPPRQPSMSGGD